MYNFLDFLGDIGGVNEGVKTFGAIIIWLVQLLIYNPFSSAIISEVFHKNSLHKSYSKSGFHCWLRCLLSRKEKREIAIGADKIEKDLEIGTFLTRYRLIWEQFRSQFKSKEEYSQYKARSAALRLEPGLIKSKTDSILEGELFGQKVDKTSVLQIPRIEEKPNIHKPPHSSSDRRLRDQSYPASSERNLRGLHSNDQIDAHTSRKTIYSRDNAQNFSSI